MKNISVIYKIQSKVNGKFYIGSAVNFGRRINRHTSDLRLNRHENILIQNHVNKYGFDDLDFIIIELVDDIKQIIQREQFYIDTLKPVFNICMVAGNCLGKKHNGCTRLKMMLAKIGKKPNNYGKKRSDEAKKSAADKNRGRRDSDKTRELKSKIQRDRVPPVGYKRKPFSKEHRDKMAENSRNRVVTQDARNRMSVSARNGWKKRREKCKI